MSFISLFDITSVFVPDLTISLWIPASAAVTVNPVGIGTNCALSWPHCSQMIKQKNLLHSLKFES